jgi:hypothetical protein
MCVICSYIGCHLAAISKVLFGLLAFSVLGHGNIEIRVLIVILKWLRMHIYNSITSFYVSTFS